jgi:23S rRNA (guanosine2251-2'-O)-methyltransferase
MEQQIIYGRKPIMDSLSGGIVFDKVMILKSAAGEEVDAITKLCKEHQVPVQIVPKEKLEEALSKAKIYDPNHQGIVAFVPVIKYYSIEEVLGMAEAKGQSPLILILDGVTDVHNLGAIARSAECMGAHGIIIQKTGSAQVNPVAVKVSAGALLKLPVCREQSLITAIKYLRAHGLKILGTDTEQAVKLQEVDFTQPSAIVMGSEGEGMTPIIKKFCDTLVSIPMTGTTESLNVSVSAGIVLYEAMRQRQ